MIATARTWVEARSQALLGSSELHWRFSKGAFWSVIAAVCSRSLALLTSLAVARLLGKHGFGELGILQSTVGTIGTLAGLGLGMGATKFVAEFRTTAPERAANVLSLSWRFALISTAVAGALLLVFAGIIASRFLGASQLAFPLRLAVGILVFTILNAFVTGALAGFEAFRKIAMVNLWSGIVTIVVTIAGTVMAGLDGAVAGAVVSLAVTFLLNLHALRACRKAAGLPEVHGGHWNERGILWSFSLPAAISGFLSAPVIWYSNVLLVNQPQGYGELGVFSAAMTWQNAILFLPQALMPMMLAVMASAYRETETGRSYWGMVKISMATNAVIAGCAGGLVLVLSRGIMRLYGDGFSSGWPVLSVIAVSAIIISICNVIGQVIASSGKMWWGLVLNSLWVITFVLLALHLVPKYGALGLALTYLSAYFLHMIWSFVYVFNARSRMPWAVVD